MHRSTTNKMADNQGLNSPINNFQQLMAITAEECGELTQVCMKIMRKYNSVDNFEKEKYSKLLVEEAGDVLCMLELMSENGLFDWKQIHNSADVKRKKLKTWSTLINDKET